MQCLVLIIKKLLWRKKIYEKYVVWSAVISEFLGLGMPLSAAEACTDKELMRTLLQNVHIEKLAQTFSIASSEKDIINFSKNTASLILKPANLSKSLLVTKSKQY